MIGIYAIINTVNGKMYIGQSLNIYNRLFDHRNKLVKGCHYNSYLQQSFNKYGSDAFEFRSLCECSEKELDEMERRFIAKYNTMDRRFGYNRETGGNAKKRPSTETLQKMSVAAKNRPEEYNQNMSRVKTGKKRQPFSIEWIQKMSDAHKGKPKTEEWKKKISAANKGKIRSEEQRRRISEARKKYYQSLREQDAETQ